MKLVFAFILVSLTSATVGSADPWVNNITVSEYNMTWGYTETFKGMDSILYRISIDNELGNNDSFINAWELLKADKETRKKLQSSINSEPDVRIDNKTSGIEVIDVDSTLSPELIGNTHSIDAIVNRYNVKYRFKDSIFNASSMWLLGQANTSVTIIIPAGIDIDGITGMDNATKNITDHTEITGFFTGISAERGEITLNLTRNTSLQVPEINATLPAAEDNNTEANATKPMVETLSRIRDASLLVVGIILILLIYIFKVRRK